MDERNAPSIDFLILADRAEAVNGKLYMLGGGWDNTWIAKLEEPIQFSVALAILVPWLATNRDHRLNLSLQDADNRVLANIQFGFKTGRPPILRDGTAQRVLLSFPFSLRLPSAGDYFVEAVVGEDRKRTAFTVHVQPPVPFLAPPAQPPS